VPTELKEQAVSQAAGMKVAYLGYVFDVPWSDLDQSKTNLYPKDKSEKTSAVLAFNSGLRLWLKVLPPREFADLWATDFKTPPRAFDALFGPGSARSDYVFVTNVYSFTPEKMHYWSLSQPTHAREQMMLITKSMMLVKAADSGIFKLHSYSYTGFQQGDPHASRDTVVVDLYSGDRHVEMLFLQKDYHNAAGVTQPEINTVVQSLHRAVPSELASSEK